jgi:hypothetical protein
MAKKIIFLSLVILAVAALGATASAQNSRPPMEGGVTPPNITVVTTMIFHAYPWCKDEDTVVLPDGREVIQCNPLCVVEPYDIQSGTLLAFAHTAFENCKHFYNATIRALSLPQGAESVVKLDRYRVQDTEGNPLTNDGYFIISQVVVITAPPKSGGGQK